MFGDVRLVFVAFHRFTDLNGREVFLSVLKAHAVVRKLWDPVLLSHW